MIASWPRCQHCDGPARPQAPASLDVSFECDTRNESNQRAPWATKKRTSQAREDTTVALSVALAEGHMLPACGPWYVLLTRRSPSRLDSDGVPRALKSVRDTVAAALGVDDGKDSIEWAYAQAKGKSLGVRVQVWGSR